MPTRTGSAALQNTVRAELSTLLPLPQPAALLCSPYSLCGPLYVPLYVPLFVPLFCCSCNSPYHPTTLPASALAAGLKRGSAEKPLRRFSAGVRTTHLRRLPASLPLYRSSSTRRPQLRAYLVQLPHLPVCPVCPVSYPSQIANRAICRGPATTFLFGKIRRSAARETHPKRLAAIRRDGGPAVASTAPALLQHTSFAHRKRTPEAHAYSPCISITLSPSTHPPVHSPAHPLPYSPSFPSLPALPPCFFPPRDAACNAPRHWARCSFLHLPLSSRPRRASRTLG